MTDDADVTADRVAPMPVVAMRRVAVTLMAKRLGEAPTRRRHDEGSQSHTNELQHGHLAFRFPVDASASD